MLRIWIDNTPPDPPWRWLTDFIRGLLAFPLYVGTLVLIVCVVDWLLG